jgi:hypothetical protein
MTRLVFHTHRDTLPSEPDNEIHVWLYGASPPFPHVGTIGAKAMDAAERLRVRPSAAAVDFLSIAMAVTAADTFVMRGDAPDAWARSFEIVLPLAEPERWKALKKELEAALLFLSSDEWSFDFVLGGAAPPANSVIKRRRRVVDVSRADCVSLFSGGLDSAIGALDLIASGKRPLLVSHAPHGDADKQEKVASLLPATCQRLSVNAYPVLQGVDEDSMRTRSFQFIALGTMAAETVGSFHGGTNVELFISENGLIGLNPPLTARRLGSHSTRTAHPYFLRSIGGILSAAGLPVTLINPYRHTTKGEMIAAYGAAASFRKFASETVSCGKWKRRNQQCGRCVPCLIRRASLHRAGIVDDTSYQYPDLHAVMQDEDGRDDLIAVQAAIIRGEPLGRWVAKSGPLPLDSKERAAYIQVARRGMDELAAYLKAQGFSV